MPTWTELASDYVDCMHLAFLIMGKSGALLFHCQNSFGVCVCCGRAAVRYMPHSIIFKYHHAFGRLPSGPSQTSHANETATFLSLAIRLSKRQRKLQFVENVNEPGAPLTWPIRTPNTSPFGSDSSRFLLYAVLALGIPKVFHAYETVSFIISTRMSRVARSESMNAVLTQLKYSARLRSILARFAYARRCGVGVCWCWIHIP